MSKPTILYISLGLLLVGLLVGGFVVYRSPLGPGLNLHPATQVAAAPTQAAVIAPTQAVVAGNAVVAQATATVVSVATVQIPTPTVAPAGMCNKSGSMTILLLGRDDKHWIAPWGADSIRLLKADFTGGKLTAFSVPRDLVLAADSLTGPYNISAERIGPIYELVLAKTDKDQAGNVTATRAVAQVLADNFGIQPDHYLTITESVFPKLVDIFGGVEVDVPQAINSKDFTLAAGKQVLNGDQADRYIRYIDLVGDFPRIERQNAVIVGLMRVAAKPDYLARVPQLYEQFEANVVTDLSLEQFAALACLANKMDTASLANYTFAPTEITQSANYAIQLKDLAASRKRIQDLFK
jgi:LCP family protein required for cell wall assembly